MTQRRTSVRLAAALAALPIALAACSGGDVDVKAPSGGDVDVKAPSLDVPDVDASIGVDPDGSDEGEG